MDKFIKDTNLMSGKGEDDVEWFTTKNGVHIPIREGQTREEAVKNFFAEQLKKDCKNGTLILPKKEYGKMCSLVNTKYANKIPPKGIIRDEECFYLFTYNRRQYRILFKFKIKIDGNEDFLNRLEGWYDYRN